MVTRVVAPYGSWRSPITPDLLVASAVRLSTVAVDGGDVYWNEGRPEEGGRQVVVRRQADGTVEDVTSDDHSVRTLVHEYGGRSYAVRDGIVVFSNFADQRLYRVDGRVTTAVTPDASVLGFASVRYADHEITPDGRWVVCVRERHPVGGGPADVVNDVVAVRLDDGSVVVIAEGHDFFLAPRVSHGGRRIAWLSWDHPDMPWDATELTVADLDPASMAVSGARVVAGGPGVSVSQPRWSRDEVLHWVSDESGWWRMAREDGAPIPSEDGHEYTGPDWVFGQSTYDFLDDGTMVRASTSHGVRELDGLSSAVSFTAFDSVVAAGRDIVCIAASPTRAPSVVRIARDGTVSVLRESQPRVVEPDYVSQPEPIEFPTTDGRTAHALYYRAHSPDFEGPEGERPPLIVLSHGGPTSATTSSLNLGIQYWTTRGVAVVDVNYGGSTGYGREYRERLKGAWGIVDVEDCVAAARWLADQGEIDGERMVIRGGSAGGYTTLAALTFRPDVFAAGCSHYGVADAEALARDTHKFESRYLDGLIGPYPDEVELYKERSPVHHTDRLSVPLILFQGLEDKVVPPEQSEMMAEVLAAKGIPHAYVAFQGEQHGFRKADTIRAVAGAELYFLGRVLGFTPADEGTPIKIVHEEKLAR